MRMKVVKHFMRKPVDFVSLSKGRGSNTASSGYSATQLGQNPFGDYAPQSTQIQGILKEMEASFQKSMAEAEEEEAKDQQCAWWRGAWESSFFWRFFWVLSSSSRSSRPVVVAAAAVVSVVVVVVVVLLLLSLVAAAAVVD